MARAIIQSGDEFKILNLASMCAYGSFETRDEAEQALEQARRADQSIGCDQ